MNFQNDLIYERETQTSTIIPSQRGCEINGNQDYSTLPRLHSVF